MHTLKPLDVEGVAELLDRFETLLVLEEPSIYYGLGTRVKAIAWDSGARCRLHTFGLKDEFIHFRRYDPSCGAVRAECVATAER